MIQFTLLLLAASCYAVISHINFHNNDYHGTSFWAGRSWKRKYKNVSSNPKSSYLLQLAPENWYYRLFKIKYLEKFPGSATVFVFLTDGYHLVQWFMIKFLILAFALKWDSGLEMNWFTFFGLWAAWLIGFNVCYTLLKK